MQTELQSKSLLTTSFVYIFILRSFVDYTDIIPWKQDAQKLCTLRTISIHKKCLYIRRILLKKACRYLVYCITLHCCCRCFRSDVSEQELSPNVWSRATFGRRRFRRRSRCSYSLVRVSVEVLQFGRLLTCCWLTSLCWSVSFSL